MPKIATTPKAYSYIRFSTPEQQHGDSLRRQTAAAEKWGTSRGVELDNSSYQDLGVSAFRGDNAETGMLREFRLAVEDGIIAPGSYLLIENLDRLSRDKPRRAVRLLEDICESGITVVTLSDQKEYSLKVLDEDPMALMWALMTAMRANEESATKSRRVREAWVRKKELAASDGRPMTQRVPAWLELSVDRREIVVRDDRDQIIKRIFREAIGGAGQHRIAHLLTSDGVPTFGDGKRRAKVWQRSYIKKILENPAVIGTMTPHSTRVVNGKRVRDPMLPILNYYPAVVSEADFDQVKIAGNSYAKMRGVSGGVSSLLAGLAHCPYCGSTMTRVNKGRSNGTPYLICVSAKNGGGCRYRQVRIDAVEQAIREKAASIFLRDMPAPDDTLNEERNRLEGQQWGIVEAIDNLVTEIERGNASPALRRRLSAAETNLAEVEAAVEAHGVLMGDDTRLSTERNLARVVDALEDGDTSAAAINGALRAAFAKCVINFPAGTLDFHWHHSDRPTEVFFAWPDAEAL